MVMRRTGIILAVVVGWIGSCSVSAAEPALDLSGKWEGCWQSHKNGHQGKLSATFCKVSDCQYRVRFHGTFLKVLPFAYTETFTIMAHSAEQVSLSAAKVLGPVLGRFEVTATATATDFTATFQAKRDCGVFMLHRKCQ